MSKTPRVSVCIPTFNGADYIYQAINSIFDQRYQDIEIVVVDNCSTDKTTAIVNDLSLRARGCIHLFKNEKNLGLAGNLNKCLEHARGEYIKFLCVDDLLLPGCLEQMVAALDTRLSVTLVCGGRLNINEAGLAIGLRRYSSRQEVIPGYRAITRCLFGGNLIGEPSAVMFRKADLVTCFRDDLPQLMDMEMWFQLLEKGDLLSIEAPLCASRIHAAQMTNANIKSEKMILDNVRINEEYSNKSYLKATPVSVILHKLLMTYRVWISRKYISSEMRESVLARYGSQVAYTIMPIVWVSLTLKREFVQRVVRLTRMVGR